VLSQKLKMMLAPPVWSFLQSTVKVNALDTSIPLQSGPIIFACLHRDMMASILYVRPAHPWLLVSGSDDGQILVKSLGHENFDFIEGATGENGGRALVKLRRTLDAGHHIGLAVDGPKGPFGTIQPGVFQLAKLTGATIVPLLPEVKPAMVFGTWDRTVVPYPFSRIQVSVGPIMKLSADADEAILQESKDRLGMFFQCGDGG